MAQNPYESPTDREQVAAKVRAVLNWWGQLCLGAISFAAVTLAVMFAIAFMTPDDPFGADETAMLSDPINAIAFLAAFLVLLCSLCVSLIGALGWAVTSRRKRFGS